MTGDVISLNFLGAVRAFYQLFPTRRQVGYHFLTFHLQRAFAVGANDQTAGAFLVMAFRFLVGTLPRATVVGASHFKLASAAFQSDVDSERSGVVKMDAAYRALSLGITRLFQDIFRMSSNTTFE